MPKISSKGAQMPSSPIRKLVPFAEKAKAEGVKVIHLNIGQPDIATPKIAIDAVKNADIAVLAYSRTEGSETYRQKIAKYYEGHGIELNSNQIVVTTGGSEALSFALGAILDHGDEIIIPEPFYANYNAFATANGVTVKPIVSTIDTNFALPPVEQFEELINSKTKAILICNPGNPTGYLYTAEEMGQLRELALRHDIFIIADEVYREFTYDGKKHHSILKQEGLEDHAIVVDSVSKRYSMCGARIGYLATRNQEVLDTVIKFAQARLSPPTMALIASEAALDTPSTYFKEVNDEYVSRRDLLLAELSKIEGVKVARPSGAFYCMVELPVDDTDVFAQWLLEEFRLNGETLMVAPAEGFYSTPGAGKNQVRIAYVLEKGQLKKAVDILKAALDQYNS